MPNPLQRLFHWITLADRSYEFLFEPGPPDEVVVVDCETTGLDPRVDDIVAIAAIRIRGNRILTSRRFEALVRPDAKPTSAAIKVHRLREADVRDAEPMRRILPDLLGFIGGRPLVGYYIDFDVRMLDKYVLGYIEAKLPNRRIDVSEMYYAVKYRGAPPGTVYDLRFDAILADLGIPSLEQHDALNDAVMTAMMYLQLKDLQERGIRLPRRRAAERPYLPTGG
jgi:DNA polymerase-3 subunit epsilon